MNAHEIDYHIYGDDIQFVEIELDPQEAVIAEPGSMMYKPSSIEMDTILGDGSKQQGGVFDSLLSAGKRLLTGEGIFLTSYWNKGFKKERVAFAATIPGKIIPLDLSLYQGKVVLQKESFLCAAKGVSVDLEFRKKLGVGLLGGEGFIMQKLTGDGWAFAHAGGAIIRKELNNEALEVDTGCLVGFAGNINYDITWVKGIKNMLFSGEGISLAHLSGNGTVWLQSLPFSRLADRIISAAPKMGGSRRGEGSIMGGLGDILMGDQRDR
ncbi:MAG TPA: TIGR00266 family protein [Flavobacteriales bacterium]|jgi:uncharacterized protein (TIGR00266 family)|nr:TIGR00266 family protein [Flavobacteriales bacterium]